MSALVCETVEGAVLGPQAVEKLLKNSDRRRYKLAGLVISIQPMRFFFKIFYGWFAKRRRKISKLIESLTRTNRRERRID
jgi:hypothetical protein